MMKLNLRHKAGLFLTLVAVGCGLFLECSAKQAAGIALLGIAFAWLIGSVTPRTLVVTLAILVCAVGLYVAVAPVWSDWNSVRNSAAQYDFAIADLQSAVKGAVEATPMFEPQGVVLGEIPNGQVQNALNAGGKLAFRIKDPSGTLRYVSQDEVERAKQAGGTLVKTSGSRLVTIPDSAKNWILQKWRSEGTLHAFPEDLYVSDAEIMQAFETKLLLPRPKFSIGLSIRAHAWNVIGGLALFISGLSVLGWLFRRTRVETRSRYAVP